VPQAPIPPVFESARADLGSVRAMWATQDRIAFDAGEDKTVELKRQMIGGQERVLWNPALSIPAEEFEFTDMEIARIKAAVQTWDSYGVTADRRWLEPVIEALFLEAPRQNRARVSGSKPVDLYRQRGDRANYTARTLCSTQSKDEAISTAMSGCCGMSGATTGTR